MKPALKYIEGIRSFEPLHWLSNVRKHITIRALILVLLALAALALLYYLVPTGDDWAEFFRPSALALLGGETPYGAGYYNAPWVLLPLIPIAVLPFQLGRTVFFVLSLVGFAYIARKLTSNPVSILLFMTSAPIVFCLNGGNLDWIPMLSFITPAPFSLIFAASKPQVGAGIAIYWLFASWRQGGARSVILNFLPVSLLLVSSFIFYGFWPLRFPSIQGVFWNVSPFPYLIPIGMFFVGWAVAKREPRPAMAAGLFFSPYYSIRSLFTLLVPLLERPKLLAVAWTVLWISVLLLNTFG